MPATGKVTQVIGSTFDAEFPEDQRPGIYNAIKVDSATDGGTALPPGRRGAAAPGRRQGAGRRPRRDRRPSSAARHALRVAGPVDELALTHLDCLPQLPPHVCTAYDLYPISDLCGTPVGRTSVGPTSLDVAMTDRALPAHP